MDKLEFVKRKYEQEKEDLQALGELLSDGRHILLGVSPESWENEEFEMYDWVFAKRYGLIKKAGVIIEKMDDGSEIKDVIIKPTKLGKQLYLFLDKEKVRS